MNRGDHQEQLDLGLPAGVVADETVAASREGLSWTWELDVEALLAAITGPASWNRSGDAADSAPAIDQADADLAEYLDAVEAGRAQVVPLPVLAGRVAESVPAGPALGGWLGTTQVTALEDGALAGVAASYRRLASWAQAGELAVIAELASRSAAADDRIGVDEHGRPAKLPQDACAEVSLALTMSQAAASWWADLAVTLRWRLAATGAALAAGTIDLTRARIIADATTHLDDETAQTVQHRVLPKAGTQTTAQLRAALRREVIAADPDGADRRREEAEKQAKVMLYPDSDGTASLGGYSLPGIPATAAMARITALARALQASGAGGGIDLLRSHVFLGLLLGTLPYIPPPADAPPDRPPPDDDGAPEDGAPEDGNPPGDHQSRRGPAFGRAAADCPGRDARLGGQRHGGQGRGGQGHGGQRRGGQRRGGQSSQPGGNGTDDDGVCIRPPPAWPDVPAFLQPGPAAMNHVAPATGAGGLLDLSLPWDTLAGHSPQPGYLGQLGPITSTQARYVADLAITDPATKWRIILTGPGGRAIATTRLARRVSSYQAGLVKQVTVTIGPDDLTGSPAEGEVSPTLSRVLAAAKSLAAHASDKADLDGRTDGGCAHTDATTAYQPTTRLRDHITARDLTCRFPTCRQPVWRCDLDHTTPFDRGGRTCSCNLGGLCRFHHQIKGQPRWRLDQATPGTFTWTTPTGRRYTIQPDSHAA